jgi:hypothetical protein
MTSFLLIFAWELSTTKGQLWALFWLKNGPMAWNEPSGANQPASPSTSSRQLSTKHTREYSLCKACGRYPIVFLSFQAMQQQI